MKFGKEFASQMVPEWQEAYVDYDYLKTLLKEIQRFKQTTRPQATAAPSGLKRNLTLYRTFSGLTHWQRHPVSPSSPDLESQAILVNSVNRNGSKRYQTTFLKPDDEGGEYELVFFKRLDDQFNKVDKFYRAKVEEVMNEASMLNKQMDALIAFSIKVDNPPGYFDKFVEMTRFASHIATSTAAMAASTPSGLRANNILPKQEKESARFVSMEIIEEGGPSSHCQSDEESGDDKYDKEGNTSTINQKDQLQISTNFKGTRPAPLEILDRVKMNKTLETPASTIKGVLQVPRNTELNFNRENLNKIKAQLRKAFKEFYQKLRLLKSYSFLNTLAISKIMKKYDKINSRNAAKSYMNMVDNSFLGTSDEVTKLMERVEATFIKHFSNSNRSKGMNSLRPKERKEKHSVTFSMGFFAGCTAALIIALILIIRAHKIMGEEVNVYMETMFPLYSLFAFVVLHMLMYAANIYFWRRYRVNYSFIFGFKQGTELGYREVLFFSSGLAVFALSTVLSNLDMEMDPITKDYIAITELLPMFVVLLVIVTLLLPFNVLYRSSRFFFLTCLFHCICAPLYKVTLPDFFLADQLTSQVQAFRSIEFYVCYYGWGDYRHRRNNCINDAYNTFYFIVAVIPFSWRLFQCLRRMFEEKDLMQGYNGLKYFLTIVAVCMRTAYSLNKGTVWSVMAWTMSAIATTFSTYWDLVHDWGFLQRKSKNRWLRDKLLVPNKNVYYVAIVLNVLLRFAWLQTVLDFHFPYLHRQTMIAIVASLEIIRRGIWNFFRLENEHLNNVGKFRAFKSVPLPFNYDEDDDKDE